MHIRPGVRMCATGARNALPPRNSSILQALPPRVGTPDTSPLRQTTATTKVSHSTFLISRAAHARVCAAPGFATERRKGGQHHRMRRVLARRALRFSPDQPVHLRGAARRGAMRSSLSLPNIFHQAGKLLAAKHVEHCTCLPNMVWPPNMCMAAFTTALQVGVAA